MRCPLRLPRSAQRFHLMELTLVDAILIPQRVSELACIANFDGRFAHGPAQGGRKVHAGSTHGRANG